MIYIVQDSVQGSVQDSVQDSVQYLSINSLCTVTSRVKITCE